MLITLYLIIRFNKVIENNFFYFFFINKKEKKERDQDLRILENYELTVAIFLFKVFLANAYFIHLWFNASSIDIRYLGSIFNNLERISLH